MAGSHPARTTRGECLMATAPCANICSLGVHMFVGSRWKERPGAAGNSNRPASLRNSCVRRRDSPVPPPRGNRIRVLWMWERPATVALQAMCGRARHPPQAGHQALSRQGGGRQLRGVWLCPLHHQPRFSSCRSGDEVVRAQHEHDEIPPCISGGDEQVRSPLRQLPWRGGIGVDREPARGCEVRSSIAVRRDSSGW